MRLVVTSGTETLPFSFRVTQLNAARLLILHAARLRSAGKDLGEAVKGFKEGMKDEDKPAGQLGDQSRSDETGATRKENERDAG